MSSAAPIKILYIIDNFSSPFAGTEGQLFKLIKGLDRSKYSPHLLLFKPSQYIEENDCPCAYTVLGSSKVLSPITWLKLFGRLRVFKMQGFKLAHILFNDPSIVAPPLLKVLGVKCIISRRDMGYWYTPSYLAFLRLNAFLVDRVIVNSEAVKQITCEKEGYAGGKVAVIYNGYENMSDHSIAPVPLKQSKEEIILGIVANIRPIKRMQDAVSALARLTQDGYACRLVIVGGGDPSELFALAEKLGVADKLNCVGSQSRPGAFIKSFDICLLCSESEGFSNAIIEYMQYGKPVICSAVGGNPEIIEHGENGYLYPAENVDMLVELVTNLLRDSSAMKRIGVSASETAINKFGLEKTIDLYDRFYDLVLAS